MSKSLQTQNKIIAAAVQQIAGEDFFHRLRLERIAEKAGVSEATIHYQFGTKEDFAKSVWQSVVDEREPYSLPKFYEEHKELLKDRAGQCKFIQLMLRNYRDFFRHGKSKSYRRLLRVFFLESMGFDNGRRKHVEQYFLGELLVFHQICKEISGLDDLYYSSMLFLFTMQPLAFAHVHLSGVRSLEKETHQPLSRHEKIIERHAENALMFHLGLLDDSMAAEIRMSEYYT